MDTKPIRSVLIGAALLAPLSAQAAGHVVLSDGAGRVEVLQQAGGPGVGILPGEELAAGSLRTGDGARAQLKTDDGDVVDLSANTQAKMDVSVDANVALGAGKVEADSTSGTRALQVHVGDALVVGGKAAHFTVSIGKKGEVAVVSTKGPVTVTSGTQSGELAEGKSVTIPKSGKLPADALAMAGSPTPAAPDPKADPTPAPAPVPEEKKPAPIAAVPDEKKPAPAPTPAPVAPTPAAPPTLAVDWPKAAIEGSNRVRGSVTGASVAVTVNGVKARVKSGKFEAKVDLAQGDQPLEVHAVDATGQEADEKQTVSVAAKPEVEAKPAPDANAGDDGSAKTKTNTSKPKVKQEASGWE